MDEKLIPRTSSPQKKRKQGATSLPRQEECNLLVMETKKREVGESNSRHPRHKRRFYH